MQELTMRIALAQLNFTIGAFEQTYRQIRSAVDRARAAGAHLAVFTELATTGYPPRDLLNHDTFIRANLDLLDRIAALTDERFGLDRRAASRRTRPARASRSSIPRRCASEAPSSARHHKTLLPTYDVFDEDRYFEPGLTVEPFDFMGHRLGLTVCEEVWNDRDFWPKRLYARDPVCELADQGADVLINISSSPFTIGKAQVRRQMIRQEAVKNARPFVYVEPGRRERRARLRWALARVRCARAKSCCAGGTSRRTFSSVMCRRGAPARRPGEAAAGRD